MNKKTIDDDLVNGGSNEYPPTTLRRGYQGSNHAKLCDGIV